MTTGKIMILSVLTLALCLSVAGCQGESGIGSTPTRTPVSSTSVPVTPTSMPASPTPTPVSPTPTPVTPMPGPVVHPRFPCGPFFNPPAPRELGSEFAQDFLDWTLDGARLIFSDSRLVTYSSGSVERASRNSLIRIVEAEGSQMQIVDAAGIWRLFAYGFHADVSPVDSRIVYTACKYWTESLAEKSYALSDYREDAGFNYEIATIEIDGTGQERLTENESFDHYPVWSPDGTRIAYISARGHPYPDRYRRGLHTMSADGSKLKRLSLPGVRVAFYPPVWSPDGEWLVFIANEGESHPFRKVLYTVRTDKSESARIGETTAASTWSPNSEELAFAALDGETPVIYAVRPDGTGLRTVWRGGPEYSSTLISQMSWSPDGSELLFLAPGAHLVRSDGSNLRILPMSGELAAWSPDGSRIAFYQPGRLLFTMSRDGTDIRILARADNKSSFQAGTPVDLAWCSDGSVVPQPEVNPDLVQDCETLLSIRDALAGGSLLPWGESTPIEQWQGITVDGSPPRVQEVRIGGLTVVGQEVVVFRLAGTLPAELSLLTSLRVLDLGENYLIGSIPTELGRLNQLTLLNLNGNNLWGSIPTELSDLKNLVELDLRGNELSGCVAVELPEIWVDASGLERCKAEEAESQ